MYKRVGVIGCGMMGRNHIRIYNELPNVKLIGVCDSNEKQAKELAEKYQVKSFTDYKDMILLCKLDAVSIVVPTSMHEEVAIHCLENGVDVLLEKPIASTITQANRITNYANKHKCRLAIGHIERFNPAVIELNDRLKRGQLGKIYKIDIDRIGPYPARIRDVGVVIDLAVHDLDILNLLTNSKPISINSMTHKHINTSNEDLLDATIKYDNNIIGHLNINWLTPTKVRQIKVTGAKGMFILDYIDQSLTFYKNGENNIGLTPQSVIEGEVIKYCIQKKEPLKSELEHFINGGLIVTGEEAKEALKQALEIIK